jgi:eukaryotic-like serine/threonine-protein kinase
VITETLGGYRLLRTIGVGSRAEVFLAHPLRAGADGAPVVIKVYGPAVSDESVVAEVEALSRAEGEHVVRVLDATSTPEGSPALVLGRHTSGSLGRVLGDRGRIAAGEAITVLAPIANALARMHSAGVAHGALGPSAILFDAGGSPTLACFGRSTLFAPTLPIAGLEAEQAVLEDVLAFGSLAAQLLEGAGATTFAQRARTEAAPGAWLTTFADSLFDLAEPLPVDLRPRGETGSTPLPARVIAASAVAVTEEPTVKAPGRELLDRVKNALRLVRRPVWIAAGASLVALIAALAAVPPPGEPATARPSPSPMASASLTGPVSGDDPVSAALVLLETRERCIRDLSVECLDDVDQRDSAALEVDRELVRGVLDGGDSPPLPTIDPDAVVLTQRLGDSALVHLGPETEPASVLLVKGEAGWRIRNYVSD